MIEKGIIYRWAYPSYYQYRKVLKALKDAGYITCRVCGGTAFFASWDDYNTWRKQK